MRPNPLKKKLCDLRGPRNNSKCKNYVISSEHTCYFQYDLYYCSSYRKVHLAIRVVFKDLKNTFRLYKHQIDEKVCYLQMTLQNIFNYSAALVSRIIFFSADLASLTLFTYSTEQNLVVLRTVTEVQIIRDISWLSLRRLWQANFSESACKDEDFDYTHNSQTWLVFPP